jgi:hypothetical protein
MVANVKYDVVKRVGKVELRQYPRLVVAQVEGYEDEAFNLLFRFISGANRGQTKVAMTAPVLSQRIAMTAPVLSERGSLAFVMPAAFSLDTTPEPLDDRVRIVEVPARTVAALRFSGRWSAALFEQKTRELRDALAQAQIRTKGSVFSMRYNAPFTPGFLRRNEVAVEVQLD